MCGIIGIISNRNISDKLLRGIKKLEYRGYDSVGIVCIDDKNLNFKKDVGNIEEVNGKVNFLDMKGNVGLGHTRWSTHGKPSKENAHPHFDTEGEIAVVHNGIIENYTELKSGLANKGHMFRSETDTEVVAHLIEEHYNGNLFEAVRKSLEKITGSYAFGIISSKEPDKLIAARNESPLIIGVGKDENFIASDVPAIADFTKKVIYLHDKEIAILEKNSVAIFDSDGRKKENDIVEIDWNPETAEKGGYEHFMLKEIHEQPNAIAETIHGRLVDGSIIFGDDFRLADEQLKSIDKVIFVACGTSWHASLIGEFMFEELSKIPVEVEYASEFRYRHPILNKNTLVIAISQSGETADTIAALKEAKRLGAMTLSICNVYNSSLTRISDSTIYTKAGPEIGVASTKAFTTQLAVLYLLTIKLSQLRNTLDDKQVQSMINSIRKIPVQMLKVLEEDKDILALAELYYKKNNSLYLGRGVNFPIALEGALKLKEVSYIHAEGYPAAEMKHGPIALIDNGMPIVFVAPYDAYTYSKILGNIEEVKARGGIVIAIVTEGDDLIKQKAEHIITIPKTLYTLSSMLAVIPLQLLAYHIARKRDCRIDQPKNLSKVVTVE